MGFLLYPACIINCGPEAGRKAGVPMALLGVWLGLNDGLAGVLLLIKGILGVAGWTRTRWRRSVAQNKALSRDLHTHVIFWLFWGTQVPYFLSSKNKGVRWGATFHLSLPVPKEWWACGDKRSKRLISCKVSSTVVNPLKTLAWGK